MTSAVEPGDAVAQGGVFDLTSQLPSGTVLLEASAGTGKTYAIAALTTRFVAEGVATLPEMIVVTFGRMATAEVRDRVRERMVATRRALSDPVRAQASDDEVERLLGRGTAREISQRRDRLTTALADFDAATIETTHGFCLRMLDELGTAGASDPDVRVVEDSSDLISDVVTDLYLARFRGESIRPFDIAEARSFAGQAMREPHAALVEPPGMNADSVAAHRLAFARDARAELLRRKSAQRLLDFDGQLTQLRDSLLDDTRGQIALSRLRRRYRVVLVDEFQDTDPVQWDILRTAFHTHTTLVLIGDPKQAIYAFRGADLATYLTASEQASQRSTLDRNWRSQAQLLRALDLVYADKALGDPRIVASPVRAAGAAATLQPHPGAAASRTAPLRLRVLPRLPALKTANNGRLLMGGARTAVADDVADDIVELLSGQQLSHGHVVRTVVPGDIAVLVRTNRQALMVRAALRAAAVPAVLTGSRSVFETGVARDWLTLLHALDQPHRSALVRAAALTPLVGWSAADLLAKGEAGVDEFADTLREWRTVLTTRGVAALVEALAAATQLDARLMAQPDGEREITDARHIGQVLHATTSGALASQTFHELVTPAALASWLQRRINESGNDAATERARRLETDAAAVQVVTVHAAKGLEFPIVYVPFGWDDGVGRTSADRVVSLHDDSGIRVLDVAGDKTAGRAQRVAAATIESAGEDLRLSYVSMTRAIAQVVAWWAPGYNTHSSSLNRLLFAADPAPGDPAGPQAVPIVAAVPSDATARSRLQVLAERSGGAIALELIEPARQLIWQPPAPVQLQLAVSTFDRDIDRAWRRQSYTSLTAGVHESGSLPQPLVDGATSEPENPGRQDEPEVGPDSASTHDPAPESGNPSLRSPLADLPVGAAFGTLVHAVFESIDPAGWPCPLGQDELVGTHSPQAAGPPLALTQDVPADLLDACEHALTGRPIGITAGDLAAALVPVFNTPLGPLGDGRPLADFTGRDRLSELNFELPMAGGDVGGRLDASVESIAELLDEHLPASDRLSHYAAQLRSDHLLGQRLRGYLTGSIDAVLRVGVAPSAAAPGIGSGSGSTGSTGSTFVVVDYKTNWLGPREADLHTSAYNQASMTSAMVSAHYPLQALLYSVALHRFLRWRLPGYRPEHNLGGVLYLFVRGMAGPATPQQDHTPHGVFGWHPPTELVLALSDLLHGRAP